MLVSIYLEEIRPQDGWRLAKEFAGNAGYRAELERLRA
jgi:hypothetical protein